MPNVRRAAAALLLLLLALFLAGCSGMDMFKDTPPTSAQEQTLLQAKAAEAWSQARYDKALELYNLVMQGQALTREARLTALERIAQCALRLGRTQEALDALDNWGQTDPKVKATWNWNSLTVQALSAMGRERQAEEHLAKLLQMRGTSFELTGPAGVELAKRYASRDQGGQAARILRTQHAKAPNRTERAAFEADTARMLGQLSPQGLASLLASVNEANSAVFPYNLVSLEDARRAASANPAARERLRDIADRLARSSDLADRDLPARILSQGLAAATSGQAPAAALPDAPALKPDSLGVALLLPQTGQLRALAAKVLAGANAAKAQLAAQGVQVDLRVINTDDASYVDHLVALPHDVTIVGGPMHASYFKNLPASGELSRRVFLSFTPSLPDAEEGKHYWRLFWSAEDVVNSVLAVPVEEGVKRYGVLYPEDPTGKRLADAFAAAAHARGAEVSVLQPYPPADAARWGDILKTMLHAVPKGVDGKSFTVRPDFEALFIPDKLQIADHLIGQLLFYQADQLVVLGPNLWAESLSAGSAKPQINPANYRYAFCSGAFWAQNPSKALAELRSGLAKANQGEPDFWTALGFDFVRLAAASGAVPPDSAPSEISKRLAEASRKIEWSMAPVTWDGSGHARMNLFFFRPSVEGLAVVDKEGFKERLDALRAKPQGQ
ncbi:Penicillin-binding protein activator LpoA [Fundidesulfovibrio magnetotacticus]|uniref:Penicillin-binding protein activator LpoA n=1 Tax=Fundidesulfovibrio magnetotacticus TaxID=2730080 RepID=A0A6V8LQ41_9BACT|nr:penicillin-binding protein activator [Fundidesulfovibrio magnetotacticus]GFK93090.1 Penicillin-binding protein activator LpoA [Fundidesulfovibrio magnetotacticus]